MFGGFDPTADSLHLGSLIPVMGLAHAFSATVTARSRWRGAATGLIGDPSGKSDERTAAHQGRHRPNIAGIRTQLAPLAGFRNRIEPGRMLDNASGWRARFVDFLRDIGKHFSVNQMIAKESVRARMEEREHGISYTEFSYMLLQAYDFVHA